MGLKVDRPAVWFRQSFLWPLCVCIIMLRLLPFVERRLQGHITVAERKTPSAPRFGQRRPFQSLPDVSESTELPSVFFEYDPSPLLLIHTMLDAAKLKQHETFLDLYVFSSC
jgi:hypothetical protein